MLPVARRLIIRPGYNHRPAENVMGPGFSFMRPKGRYRLHLSEWSKKNLFKTIQSVFSGLAEIIYVNNKEVPP
jgi:hypothetical protein